MTCRSWTGRFVWKFKFHRVSGFWGSTVRCILRWSFWHDRSLTWKSVLNHFRLLTEMRVAAKGYWPWTLVVLNALTSSLLSLLISLALGLIGFHNICSYLWRPLAMNSSGLIIIEDWNTFNFFAILVLCASNARYCSSVWRPERRCKDHYNVAPLALHDHAYAR